jgi:hypothetical protein
MYTAKSYKRREKKEISHGLITQPGQNDPLFDQQESVLGFLFAPQLSLECRTAGAQEGFRKEGNYSDASKGEYDAEFVIAAGPEQPGRVFTRNPSSCKSTMKPNLQTTICRK